MAHAAARSANGLHVDHTSVVVLAARDEADLIELDQRLAWNRIPHILIREPDMGDAATAIGIEPMDRSTLKRLLGGYKLIR